MADPKQFDAASDGLPASPRGGLSASWIDALRDAQSIELPAFPSLVLFRLGGREFAFRARNVGEVGLVGFSHRVPHRDAKHFLGLAVVEGDLVPLGSLHQILDLAADSAGEDRIPRLITLDSDTPDSGRWSVIVDEVHGVEMYDPADWKETGDTESFIEAVIGTSRGPTELLDVNRLCEILDGALA